MNAERTDRIPVVEGVVAGIAAWLVGYASTFVIVAPDVRDSPLHRFIEAFAGEPATYEMVGWVFYNAHFVDTVFNNVPLIGSHTTSFIGGEDGFTTLLYAIPIGVLVAVGIGLAYYQQATSPAQGAIVGVLAVPGYLLLTAAGVFFFEVTLGEASGAPDLMPAIFLAGIVWPILFAGGGGAIAGLFSSQ